MWVAVDFQFLLIVFMADDDLLQNHDSRNEIILLVLPTFSNPEKLGNFSY